MHWEEDMQVSGNLSVFRSRPGPLESRRLERNQPHTAPDDARGLSSARNT